MECTWDDVETTASNKVLLSTQETRVAAEAGAFGVVETLLFRGFFVVAVTS